jgi:hypothetical protein
MPAPTSCFLLRCCCCERPYGVLLIVRFDGVTA